MITNVNEIFAKNLKRYMEQSGKTQADIIKDLGVTSGTTSSWCSGKKLPRMDKVQRLADYFGVTTGDLLEERSYIERNENRGGRGVKIPVLGLVQAGLPVEAVEDILDWEEITPELAATGEYCAFQIRGNSMEPRMVEGDVIIVRKQDIVDTNDIAVVMVNGDEATVKRVKITSEGITLIPLNPAYPVMFFTPAEVSELPVRILGRVVELRGKL